MHEALYYPELLGLICQNCDRHTLSQLSLTNRSISGSALEELWSSIENFGPLIRCMPADLWEERISSSISSARSLSFRRPILDTDYEKFLFRAALVRTIGFSPGSIKYDVDPEALLALSNAAPDNTKLLPQLRKLDTAFLLDCHGLLSLPRLLSPTITHVDIREDGDSLLLILPAIVYECPSVVQARLLCTGQSMPRSIPVLQQWSNLQALVVCQMHPLVAFAAASLPALKEFAALLIDYNPIEPIPKMPKGFSSLERLLISGCNSEFSIELMRHMDQPSIESITIDFLERITLDIWLGFLTAMNDGIVHDRVKYITIDARNGQRFDKPFTIEMITPLLCYTNLSVIHLASLHGFNFDDASIDAMASSWKELKAFYIETVWQPPARATFKSLVSIARHNKRLEKLMMFFDASTITNDILKVRPWKGICNKSLRMLDVRCSPIEDPDLVADFLIDIFPNLVQISFSADLDNRAHAASHSDSPSQVRCARWAQVERLLRVDMGQSLNLY